MWQKHRQPNCIIASWHLCLEYCCNFVPGWRGKVWICIAKFRNECTITHKYFIREAENKGPLLSFPKSQDWAAVTCGIGNWSIQRTLQESLCAIKNCGFISFLSPRKSTMRSKKTTKPEKLITLPKNYTQTVEQINVSNFTFWYYCVPLPLTAAFRACNGYIIITYNSNVCWFFMCKHN
jgi:hypothetical protein